MLDRLLSQVVRAIDPRYAGLDSSEYVEHLYLCLYLCMHACAYAHVVAWPPPSVLSLIIADD